MSEWKPIESAPKDGTMVLLGNAVHAWRTAGGWREAHQDWWDSRDEEGCEFPPTHWMPLPDPPQ